MTMRGTVRPATGPNAFMNARVPQHDDMTRADLDAFKADLIRELASKAEVERLRADLTSAIASLESRISRLEGTLRTLLWGAGIVGAIVVAAAFNALWLVK